MPYGSPVSNREKASRDDIYYLRTVEDLGTKQGMPFYGMSEENAILGGALLLNGTTYLIGKTIKPKFGKLVSTHFIDKLLESPEEVKEEIEYHRWPEGGIDWIQVNRRARRVEIYNKR